MQNDLKLDILDGYDLITVEPNEQNIFYHNLQSIILVINNEGFQNAQRMLQNIRGALPDYEIIKLVLLSSLDSICSLGLNEVRAALKHLNQAWAILGTIPFQPLLHKIAFIQGYLHYRTGSETRALAIWNAVNKSAESTPDLSALIKASITLTKSIPSREMDLDAFQLLRENEHILNIFKSVFFTDPPVEIPISSLIELLFLPLQNS